MFQTYDIIIYGLVQGVGFRPFVYRMALEHNIKGFVINRTDGLIIKASGRVESLTSFIESIKHKNPPAAVVTEIKVSLSEFCQFSDFRIKHSDNIQGLVSQISPDIAVCGECINDMNTQGSKHAYPFVNCTNCGPRFTIIKQMPYDRQNTTMSEFKLCDECKGEFTDISNRRFHAQPVACNTCGPEYSLKLKNGKIIETNKSSIEALAALIDNDGVAAIKGLGGFNISCSAHSSKAIERIRELKNRDGKPFAVLFRDIDTVQKYCKLTSVSKEALLSWQRPIVIVAKGNISLPDQISSRIDTVGAMLPYLPMHYLLFEHLQTDAIVLTSGNISDTPIIIDDRFAEEIFMPLCDAVLTSNRDIYNRVDDSVVYEIAGEIVPLRRSRGYVPTPIFIEEPTSGILACGAELSNCFAVGNGKQLIMSQHIGDLKNMETFDFYTESIDRFRSLYRLNFDTIVCDMHPDYISTRYAERSGLNIVKVQHHHAHIASCMAENKLDEKVIGLAMDGTGYGTDGNIWGGEIMLVDLENYERSCHFEYIAIPGGDKAAYQP